MPCYTIVRVRVTDEASARDALAILGLVLKKHGSRERVAGDMLRKIGDEWEVAFVSPEVARKFRQQYAKAFAVREARRKFYQFAKEEVLADGSIKLTFDNGS